MSQVFDEISQDARILTKIAQWALAGQELEFVR